MAGSGGDASSTPPPASEDNAGIFSTVASWAGSAVRYAAESVNRCSVKEATGSSLQRRTGCYRAWPSAGLPGQARRWHPDSQGTTADAPCCARSVFGFYDDLEVTDPDAGSSEAAKDHADTSDVRPALTLCQMSRWQQEEATSWQTAPQTLVSSMRSPLDRTSLV